MSKPTVFISYSHKDEVWKDRLETQLRVLQFQGMLQTWTDRQIDAGDDWFARIEEAMNRAAVAILLISADSLTSEFILREEVTTLMQRRQRDGLRIFPVIVRPCPWQEVGWLSRMQCRPKDGRALSSNTKAKYEELLAAIAAEVAQLLKRAPRDPSVPGTMSPLPPEDIALAKLPSTNPELFGRERELYTLDTAWDDPTTNIVTLVAFGGVGKTALVNKWLLHVRDHGYRGAERVYGWSFYSQGASQDKQASGDEFLAAALTWFGEGSPPRSAWEKGQRLARLVREHPTLLILDGLEPLQHPPGEQAGKLRDPGVESLLRELAVDNPGLCVISTRLAVDDLKGYVGSSVQAIDLEDLSPAAGAQLLRKMGVEGSDDDLHKAAGGFEGHALALTLLGRYLAIVHGGDVRKRDQVPELTVAARDGGHARRLMESYERWFAGKPELDILRMMGLFDRPTEGGAIEALRAEPAIDNLTTELEALSDADWHFAIGNLRDAGLLAKRDPDAPGTLDCHALIRDYFARRVRTQNPKAWREGHKCLYEYFKSPGRTKKFPDTIEEMGPLLLAAVHGCKAGRHADVFHNLYIPRIMRGDKYYTAHALGAMGPILLVLRNFFEHDDWGQPVSQGEAHSQGLDPDDQRTVLTDAGIFLSAVRGWGVPEVHRVFTRALELCQRKRDRFQALRGLWGYYLLTADSHLKTARRVAEECLDIANNLDRSEFLVEAHMMLGVSLFYSGELKNAHDNLLHGIKLYNREAHSFNCFLYGLDPGVTCQSYAALVLWILGYPDRAVKMGKSAIDLAGKVPHPFSRSVAQCAITTVHQFRRDPGNTAVCANEAISFAKLNGFVFFRLLATIDSGWAYVDQGNVEDGIDRIHQALEELRATGTIMSRSAYLTVLAECHINAHRYSDADHALEEALDLLNRYGDRHKAADLYRVQAKLLGARSRPTEAESRFRYALRTAREQDARSLELRAATDLARLLSGTEQETETYHVLSAVYNSFTEGLDTEDLKEAKALLDGV